MILINTFYALCDDDGTTHANNNNKRRKINMYNNKFLGERMVE